MLGDENMQQWRQGFVPQVCQLDGSFPTYAKLLVFQGLRQAQEIGMGGIFGQLAHSLFACVNVARGMVEIVEGFFFVDSD